MPLTPRSPTRSRESLLAERLEPRRLLAAAPWIVHGDDGPSGPDDVIVVERDPENPALLQVVVNGQILGRRPIAAPGSIRIYGGRGNDEIRVDVPGLRRGLTLFGGPGNDRITGGPGNDRIDGGRGDDWLDGAAGNDRIQGGRGQDVVLGGEGDDSLGGQGGADTLVAGSGRDRLHGGAGSDRIFAAAGRDRIARDRGDRLHESKQVNPVFRAEGEAEVRRFLRLAGGPDGPSVRGRGTRDGLQLAALELAAADHSGTNTQVAGVEEADLVRTDGRFLYAVVAGELLVIDADPSSLAVVSRTPLPGQAAGLFLDGGRVSVVSTEWTWPEWTWPGRTLPTLMAAVEPPPRLDVTEVGQDELLPVEMISVDWTHWETPSARTLVSVFDMADPAAPALVERTALEGWLLAARAIGADLTLLVESTADLRAAAAGGPLPGFMASAAVHVAPGGGDRGIVTIARLSPLDDTPGIDDAAVLVGMGGTVYASQTAVYLASTSWTAAAPATSLTAFSLGDRITHLGSGTVPGFVPDQFAMDEHADGTFRIATQSGWGDSAATALHVLRRQGADFIPLGSVGGIAPGEDLKAVRFLGEQAFVVTFEQVDPLFVIDLADPRSPRVTGELKIPGFSSYLHPMEQGRLFGIGRGDEANTGKLSLFDVSDPAAPSEIDALTLGGPDGWTFSEAAWDHHAFAWFAAEGLLAVPVTTWDWTAADAEPDHDFLVSVFAVDREAGFAHAFDVRHDDPVLRSLRIGGLLYTVSTAELAVHELHGSRTELGRISLGSAATPPPDAWAG